MDSNLSIDLPEAWELPERSETRTEDDFAEDRKSVV